MAGIICVTFTKRMTSTIATCFMDRVVDKYYLAIVHGHVSIHHGHSSTRSPMDNSLLQQSQEQSQQQSQEQSQQSQGQSQQGQSQDSHNHTAYSFTIQAPIAEDKSDPTGFKCCIGDPTNPGQV
jgi:23S rRNA-/tRNA-specific pseudouridylate synthase